MWHARTRTLRPSLALALTLALPMACAHAAGYTLDPDHSFVYFEITHFRTSTIRGRFGPVQGHVAMDPAAGTGELGISVDTRQVDSGMALFNRRLREPDLLNSESDPTVWFVARRFRFEQGRLAEVRGELTLRGVSRPLSLMASSFSCRDDERFKREVCGGDFEATFNRSEFGITFGRPFIGDTVRLLVQVEAVRD